MILVNGPEVAIVNRKKFQVGRKYTVETMVAAGAIFYGDGPAYLKPDPQVHVLVPAAKEGFLDEVYEFTQTAKGRYRCTGVGNRFYVKKYHEAVANGAVKLETLLGL